jgi:ADP-heptose:LPS heptosyltransferase/glycosyltransferase involved in cell wall biosynthesis
MEKILIIQMCRMGDLVQTLPLLKRLKDEQKGCEITLMCIRESVGLIQNSPLVDRFISLPERFYNNTRGRIESDPAEVTSVWEFPALYSHYDLVINLTHDLSSGILCERVPGERKFGRVHTVKDEIRVLGEWAKYLFAVVKNRTQNLLNLVDIHVGMGSIPHKPVQDWLPVGGKALEKGKMVLKNQGHQEKGALIALQMGANQLHRAWPIENFAALARQLRKRSDAEIVLLGSSKEAELGAEFLRQVDFPVINLIGKTQVIDLPAILKICHFLVSNDTGTAHIAAAVGTRVLGLYFSTAYWGETAPYGQNNIILQVELPCSPCLYTQKCDTVDCKQYLTVEAVVNAASMMLSGQIDQDYDYPHLSLYHSRFLANGTLAYIPISRTISESYQTGFINRILWEEALGLTHDPGYICHCLSRLRHLDPFRSRVAACQEEHSYLRDQYHQAMRLAQHIILECYQKPPDEHKIRSLNNALMGIQDNISKLPLSLMQCYQTLELMDTDYTPHPQLADQLVKKYSKLYGISNGSTNLLEGLLSPDPQKWAPGSINCEKPEAHDCRDEVLYLGLASGENFGWGICGAYLTKELSKRVETISLGDHSELGNNQKLPGRVFHTLRAIDLATIFPARGTQNFGYTFFENELSPQSVRNAGEYDLVFVGSTWCQERLLEAGIKHFQVLIQGVDQEIFYPITTEKGREQFVILSGGKFELRKGQDLVLQAIKVLQTKYRDIVLINVWYNKFPQIMHMMSLSPHIRYEFRGGSWLEIMNHIYRLNGLDASRIITYPLLPSHQLRSIYQQTDLGLFPSRCEGGTNLVLMEYMACAKPAVATYTSGHKDIVTERNSLMLTDRQPLQLHDKHNQLLASWEEPSLDELIATVEYAYHHRDEIKAIGKQAGEDLQQFTWERTAAKVLEVVFG